MINRPVRHRRRDRGRMVFVAPPVPAWVPEPEPVPTRTSRLVRVAARAGRGPGRLQPVEEAALRTLSDASAVSCVLGR